MGRSNLLEQTKKAIGRSNHSIEDIVYIGSRRTGHSCTWDDFCKLADKEYDDGYGSQEVAEDLTITFKDNSILLRWEYDGREWWKYIYPIPPESQRSPIKEIFIDDYLDSLEEIANRKREDRDGF